MGQAKLYGQKKKVQKEGFDINGIIADYYVYAGENISAGDFVEFVNGVASSTTETKEAPVNIFDTLLTTYESGIGPVVGNAILLRDGRIFIAYSSTDFLVMSILTLKNNIFEVGTITNYEIGSYLFFHNLSLLQINDSQIVLYCHRYEIGGGFSSSFKDISLLLTIGSDNVITVTTLETFTSTQDNDWVPMLLVEDNRYIRVRLLDGAYATVAEMVTISGETLTINSTRTIGSGTSDAKDSSFCLEKIGDNKAFLSWANGSSTSKITKGCILTWSGNTISSGTIRTDSVGGGIALICYLGEGKFCSIGTHWSDSSTRNYSFRMITVNGTSIIFGARNVFYEAGVINVPFLIAINSSKVFCSYSDETNKLGKYGILNISGDVVTMNTFLQHERGYKATCGFLWKENVVFYNYAQITEQYTSQGVVTQTLLNVSGSVPETTYEEKVVTYETQVQPTTTSKFVGIAKTSGVGGDSTGHNQQIKIYQPYSTSNLITNGDFEDGVNGWSIIPAGTASYTTLMQVDNGYLGKCAKFEIVQVYTSTVVGNTFAHTVPTIAGHKYYGYGYIKGQSNNVITMGGLNTGVYVSLQETGVGYVYGNYVDGNVTDWTKSSFYHTATATTSDSQFRTYMRIGNKSDGTGDLVTVGMGMYYDNMRFYDLTAMFGAGNEPTQEWCDKNL